MLLVVNSKSSTTLHSPKAPRHITSDSEGEKSVILIFQGKKVPDRYNPCSHNKILMWLPLQRHYSIVVKSTGYRVKLPGFKTCLLISYVGRFLNHYFSFHNLKVKMSSYYSNYFIEYLSYRILAKIKWKNT